MKDNKNIAVVDTTDIKHIIDELRLINTDVISKLYSKDNSLYNVLNEMNYWLGQNIYKINHSNKMTRLINSILTNNKKYLTDTVNLLAKIEKPLTIAIENFNELSNKIENNEILENYKRNLDSDILLIHDYFIKSINKECSSLENKINLKFEEINKSVENNMEKIMEKINSEFLTLDRKINKNSINVDAEKLTNLNNSISKSLKNINTFNDSAKKLQKQYFILIAVSSFCGGVLISSTLIWLIINKL